MQREIPYNEAIREGLHQAMELSDDVVVMGQLVDYKSGIFGTTTGLADRFGTERVQDFPVSEATMTSVAMGAAVNGLRPVIVHQRLDFMIYSLDTLVNWLSLWNFKSNGKSRAPVTIRAIVGKGWGQGPQHSKSLQAWFGHLPGLRVAMPSTAFDAKGLLLESIFGEDPTIIIEGRGLFSMKDAVPEVPYRVRFGEAAIRRPGKDLTLVAIGYMVPLAMKAANEAAQEGMDVEVIDLRTVSPWDRSTVLRSVAKTGRLIVADPAWRSLGFAAEVVATVSESMGSRLKAPPRRICLPDSHTPMSAPLENAYYPSNETFKRTIKELLK
jgi:acetoin:2,6-dichlorophenolindophenol oxidoreductase subunit beta